MAGRNPSSPVGTSGPPRSHKFRTPPSPRESFPSPPDVSRSGFRKVRSERKQDITLGISSPQDPTGLVSFPFH